MPWRDASRDYAHGPAGDVAGLSDILLMVFVVQPIFYLLLCRGADFRRGLDPRPEFRLYWSVLDLSKAFPRVLSRTTTRRKWWPFIAFKSPKIPRASLTLALTTARKAYRGHSRIYRDIPLGNLGSRSHAQPIVT